MRIHIEVVPHKAQKYDTCGDWRFINGDLYIQVSAMGDWCYETLVGIHEAIEAVLCRHRGIDQSVIDAFDKEFEIARAAGQLDTNYEGQFVFRERLVDLDAEPGDDQDAPYRAEHFFATSIERLLAAELKVDWREYDKVVASL